MGTTAKEEYNKAKEEYPTAMAQANGTSVDAAEAGVATSAVAAAADSSTSADDGPKLRLEWEGMDEKTPKVALKVWHEKCIMKMEHQGEHRSRGVTVEDTI